MSAAAPSADALSRRRRIPARVRRLLWAAAALVLVGCLLYVARLWRLISSLVHPRHSVPTADQVADAHRGLPGLVDVELHTGDGLQLAAWFAPGSNGAAVVFVHGLGDNRAFFLQEAEALAGHGYGVLLLDLRDHGGSEGDLCTWGDRERNDVAAAVGFLASRPEVHRIGAVGLSIGASSVALEATADERLRAIVLEGATPSFREGEQWDERPWEYETSFAIYKAYGLHIDEIDIVAALHRMSPRPVLVVIGTEDPFIPRWMTDEVVAANPSKTAPYVVAGAGHGRYAQVAGKVYLDHLAAFFDEALRP